uniref:Uncharacterized protein n=1 Tax=Picea glauca TaxID=3330 RepID=A0A101M3R4_PICGL|nr:hypothetical protein ABT39_MTgene215 [Picea glauca]
MMSPAPIILEVRGILRVSISSYFTYWVGRHFSLYYLPLPAGTPFLMGGPI